MFQLETDLRPMRSIFFNKLPCIHRFCTHMTSTPHPSCRDMLKGTFFPCSFLLWISNYEKQIITMSLSFFIFIGFCLPVSHGQKELFCSFRANDFLWVFVSDKTEGLILSGMQLWKSLRATMHMNLRAKCHPLSELNGENTIGVC